MADLEAKFEAGRSYLVAGQLLNDILRELRLSRIVAGDGIEETAGPTGRVFRALGGPGAAATPPLTAYIRDGEVAVTPGYVNGVMPTLDGSALDATVTPSLAPSEGDNWLHLRGTYEPSTYELAAGYIAIGAAGTVSAVSFVLTGSPTPSPAEDYPKLTSGATAVDGHFDILWGKIVKDGDSVVIEIPSGGGDAAIVFMPPDLYVAFRDVNVSGS
jgi:hypothetical protein